MYAVGHSYWNDQYGIMDYLRRQTRGQHALAFFTMLIMKKNNQEDIKILIEIMLR